MGMLFYMDSKTFLTTYLEREEDWRILDAYYVVTTFDIHVRNKKKYATINYAPRLFYPTADVLYADNEKDLRIQYELMLKREPKTLETLAEYVWGSLVEGYNIIFLTTSDGFSSGYIRELAHYVMTNLKYPMYDYKRYIKGKEKPCKYDPEEVLSIVEPIRKKTKEKYQKSTEGKAELLHKIKTEWPKKKLKKKLDDLGYYTSDESKEELIDMYISIRFPELSSTPVRWMRGVE